MKLWMLLPSSPVTVQDNGFLGCDYSSSAEHVLSRVRITKNRLRTSMADDWFSALTDLAAESTVLGEISIDEIIDSFAHSSHRLREHLL